jgi:hypothetical protein
MKYFIALEFKISDQMFKLTLNQGCPTPLHLPTLIFIEGPTTTHVKITVSDILIPNLPNYCGFFTIHILYTNLTIGHITKPVGELWVGHPCSKVICCFSV